MADTEAAALSVKGKNLRAMAILVGIVAASFTVGSIYMRWDMRMEAQEKIVERLAGVVEKLAERMVSVERTIDRFIATERK